MTIDLKNAKNEQIYVSERIPHPTTWYTDTIQLKDGKAVFKGKVTDPHWVAFVVVRKMENCRGLSECSWITVRYRLKGTIII